MSWRVRSLALLALALGLGVSGATAANRFVYTDSTGDNGGAGTSIFAADIRQVVISNDDRGLVHFDVTVADPEASLIQGDEVDILIDYDRNAKTGQKGIDYQLSALGHGTGGQTTFAFCRAAALACEIAPFDLYWPNSKPWNVHDTKVGTGLHVVSFDLRTGRPSINFLVETSFPNTQGYANRYDYAPDPPGKFLTYEILGTDGDNDHRYGYADKCPSVRAPARLDKNRNGCPGPFAFLRPDRPSTALATRSGGSIRVTNMYIAQLPAGAKVVFSSSAGTYTAFANYTGIARIWRGTRSLRIGSSMRIKITRAGYVGLFRRYRITSSRFKLARELCIRPVGGGLAPCSTSLRGR